MRTTVELPNRDVHKWWDSATRRSADPDWRHVLVKAAGGGSGTWRITEKPIPETRWIVEIDRATGTRLVVPAGGAMVATG